MPPRLLLVLSIVVLLVVGCSSATPAPEPTVPPTSTVEPTVTPVPPTATPEPTATPVPAPSVTNLRFATQPDMAEAQADGAEFKAGSLLIYAAFDYANVATTDPVKWTVKRDGRTLLFTTSTIAQATGQALHAVADDARQLLPGQYEVHASIGSNSVKGTFTIGVEGVAPGATILTDNFDNNLLNWQLNYSWQDESSINDGRLTVKAKDKETTAWAELPAQYGDFDLVVAVTLTEPDIEGLIRVFFRSTEQGEYVFDVSSTRLFAAGVIFSDEYTPLIDWTRTTAFKPAAENTLRITARGEQFAFYINDELVGSMSDDRLSSGQLALGVASIKTGGVTATFDRLVMTMPDDTIVMAPTPTTAPIGTPRPKATAVPSTPPLADAVKRVRSSVEALGGALDRLYHGGGAEACGPLLENLAAVVGAPDYNVASQPGNVQTAYALYQSAIDLMGDKMRPIAQVCLSGGGMVGKLDFDLARTAINQAGSLLSQALGALGN